MNCIGIFILVIVLYGHYAEGQGKFSITQGPSEKTVEVGTDFELPCVVANKGDSDTVFWKLFPHNTQQTLLLTLDSTSKNSSRYSIKTGTYYLQVKSPSYDNDGVYECEAGTDKKSARVYVYDKPESMTLEWQHGKNGPGSVKAGSEYKLKCTSKNSHPPAEHVYYKDGAVLSLTSLQYEFNNYTNNPERGYGDTVSYLPFTPSENDVKDMATIKCAAKLYTKIDASAVQFRINEANGVSICFGILLMTTFSKLLM